MGRVRVTATSTERDRPVFVGIARSGDVRTYLRGAAYSEVRDFDQGSAGSATHTGTRAVAPPASRTFWTATAQGAGAQSLTWKLRPGHWELVVMNADGSAGVDAAVSAGAHTPPLLAPGLGLLAIGVLIGLGAALGLSRASARGPAPAPAAAIA
jgi:hypothetical protein